jgi:hypothetical protein
MDATFYVHGVALVNVGSEMCDAPVSVTLARGQIAVISQSDADWVLQRPWYLASHGYVAGSNPSSGKAEYLHRLVCRAGRGEYVDHIDRNKLNNTRANLRICTNAQNNANAPAKRSSKSQYRGVHFNGSFWVVQICENYQTRHVGSFSDEIAAAAAYNIAARCLRGAFAYQNPVDVSPDYIDAHRLGRRLHP